MHLSFEAFELMVSKCILSLHYNISHVLFMSLFYIVQVRVCREKTTGTVYAMKKLKKSEMLRRGQVYCN